MSETRSPHLGLILAGKTGTTGNFIRPTLSIYDYETSAVLVTICRVRTRYFNTVTEMMKLTGDYK